MNCYAALAAKDVAMDFDADDSDKLPELPPMGHPLQKLGARLAELLDDDHWAECERLLLEGWAHGIKTSHNLCLSCGHSIDAHDRQYGCAEDGCDCETPNAKVSGRRAGACPCDGSC